MVILERREIAESWIRYQASHKDGGDPLMI
jgi:hypothetical protein